MSLVDAIVDDVVNQFQEDIGYGSGWGVVRKDSRVGKIAPDHWLWSMI